MSNAFTILHFCFNIIYMNDFYTIVVRNSEKNDTIYTYLKRLGHSENYLKNLRKKQGYILLNESVVFINQRIKDNDIIKTHINPNQKTQIQFCDIPLDIVYEDSDIILINKPPHLATMPSRSHYNNNLSGAIAKYMSDKDPNFVVRIVNRLDKDTSGLIIVAKNSIVCNYFNNHQDLIEKTYFAICEGILQKNLVIEKNILTQKNEYGFNDNKRITTDLQCGKSAQTFVYIEKILTNSTLVSLKLKNGRTHQIRVHMSSIGHPLVGDSLYGKTTSLINRTALVCKKISFVHPITNKKLGFEIDFPNDFKSLME